MTEVFSTRRVRDDVAARVAQPRRVADVLTPQGVDAVRATADRAARAHFDSLARQRANPTASNRANVLAHAEAGAFGADVIDPRRLPPDQRLVTRFGAQQCIKHRVIPWRSSAGRIIVLAASRDRFLKVRDALRVLFGDVHLAIVASDDLDAALGRICHKTLMSNAEQRTAPAESCRDWNAGKAMRWGSALTLTLLACLITWPTISFLVLCSWAIITLALTTALKVTAAILQLRAKPVHMPASDPSTPLPTITILVPLFRERDIAGALVRRLSNLDYPQDKLDVCLVLEADDGTTQNALDNAQLPFWMRAIKVPLGTLQTKPRALNYALNFARGSIIGVYDAEDAPDSDQLYIVANHFARADPKLACLQGRLDFYNAHSNWLARCFTIEYATWFRVILPGLERLKLAIPLGGTTLFFRRDILEELGGWDAHNVTEDADLGIRLTRHGYRTEIIDTVTQEEANARAWPWIKQRSRWLKGYTITYGVHMRNPLKLLKDLGPRRFLGVQLLFAGTISQFLLAPVLWSFWLLLIGLPHPLEGVLSTPVMWTIAGIFIASEVLGIAVSILAVSITGKREMIPWTPTLHLYFPLAAMAAYKGIFELATKPFYWDKTVHGVFAPTQAKSGAKALAEPGTTTVNASKPESTSANAALKRSLSLPLMPEHSSDAAEPNPKPDATPQPRPLRHPIAAE